MITAPALLDTVLVSNVSGDIGGMSRLGKWSPGNGPQAANSLVLSCRMLPTHLSSFLLLYLCLLFFHY